MRGSPDNLCADQLSPGNRPTGSTTCKCIPVLRPGTKPGSCLERLRGIVATRHVDTHIVPRVARIRLVCIRLRRGRPESGWGCRWRMLRDGGASHGGLSMVMALVVAPAGSCPCFFTEPFVRKQLAAFSCSQAQQSAHEKHIRAFMRPLISVLRIIHSCSRHPELQVCAEWRMHR